MSKLSKFVMLGAMGAAGTVCAQSSVTLYGTADAGVLSISNTATGKPGYIPSPNATGRTNMYKDGGIGASNWGLRGKEDLGGGYGATFQFQGNINTSSGGAGGPNSSSGQSLFNQVARVGLSGPFGEIKHKLKSCLII